VGLARRERAGLNKAAAERHNFVVLEGNVYGRVGVINSFLLYALDDSPLYEK
jgi:hypothetical protein